MSEFQKRQSVYLFRHGETEWSKVGKHTSNTDLPLTPYGVEQAVSLAAEFKNMNFDKVFCSPLFRARKTCEIMGLLDAAEIDNDLKEWNYGDYEGIETSEIRKSVEGWSVFTHSCPNGESIAEVQVRADRMIQKIKMIDGDVALFSSAHLFRVLAARWVGLPAEAGKYFVLNTGTFSILDYERENPIIKVWNNGKNVQY